MIRITAFAGALLCLLITGINPVIAGSSLHRDCNVLWPCEEISKKASKHGHKSVFWASEEISPRQARQITRAQRFNRTELGGPMLPPETEKSFFVRQPVSGLVAPLADKLASIQSACPGTVAISGVRHTYVAGTRRISLHASGKAVDVRGPYGCIYAQLRGWQGGYSTDAGRVRHIHISYDADGGREMGLAFRHGGGGRKHARRAHRHRIADAAQ